MSLSLPLSKYFSIILGFCFKNLITVNLLASALDWVWLVRNGTNFNNVLSQVFKYGQYRRHCQSHCNFENLLQ